MSRDEKKVLVEEVVEWLRVRLPGRSDAELRAIAEEEVLQAQVRAVIERRRAGGVDPRGCG